MERCIGDLDIRALQATGAPAHPSVRGARRSLRTIAPTSSVNGLGGDGVSDVGTWQFQCGSTGLHVSAVSSRFRLPRAAASSTIQPTRRRSPSALPELASALRIRQAAGNRQRHQSTRGFGSYRNFDRFNNSSTAGTATITNTRPDVLPDASTAGKPTSPTIFLTFRKIRQPATPRSSTPVAARSSPSRIRRPPATPPSPPTARSQTQFSSNSTAGNARLIVNAGGLLAFRSLATAGSATITSTDGFITFEDNSTAGNAAITANGAGSVDFSGTTGPNGDNKISAGSIARQHHVFPGRQPAHRRHQQPLDQRERHDRGRRHRSAAPAPRWSRSAPAR